MDGGGFTSVKGFGEDPGSYGGGGGVGVEGEPSHFFGGEGGFLDSLVEGGTNITAGGVDLCSEVTGVKDDLDLLVEVRPHGVPQGAAVKGVGSEGE